MGGGEEETVAEVDCVADVEMVGGGGRGVEEDGELVDLAGEGVV